MGTPVWEFQFSVETEADPQFAWDFWTDIANWREHEPGVEFELDGPFAEGSHGTTKMPGQEPHHWVIRAVDPGRSWTQEILLPGASFLVSMQFDKMPEGGTRITQRLWLEGDTAPAFVDAVRTFETTTPDGLKRIAGIIENAQRISGARQP